jgi:hypothetical protein
MYGNPSLKQRTHSKTGSMNYGQEYHTASTLANGQVLVTGGPGGTNSVELYDP